ncbi:MAG: class I SAM-dependent methyltransferase [Patescibacteria group bacterium]|nr:class I SAM-dependent methyltransferase [Patescibacteria group bacterium]
MLITKFFNDFFQISPLHDYGDLGYFSKKDPKTSKYTFANWGSRRWEYAYIEKILSEIGIKNKKVVDIGIGLPSSSNFHNLYLKSGCHLIGFDPDDRLKKITKLSAKCKIYRQSAEKIPLSAKSTDIVVVISSFEHFPIKIFNKTIKEIHRILKDDGRLIVTLDLTYDKTKSARWAILEKTLNRLPPQENDQQLKPFHKHLTLELFLQMVSAYFYVKNNQAKNKNLELSKLVYSKEWNSYIGYANLYKKRKDHGLQQP